MCAPKGGQGTCSLISAVDGDVFGPINQAGPFQCAESQTSADSRASSWRAAARGKGLPPRPHRRRSVARYDHGSRSDPICGRDRPFQTGSLRSTLHKTWPCYGVDPGVRHRAYMAARSCQAESRTPASASNERFESPAWDRFIPMMGRSRPSPVPGDGSGSCPSPPSYRHDETRLHGRSEAARCRR